MEDTMRAVHPPPIAPPGRSISPLQDVSEIVGCRMSRQKDLKAKKKAKRRLAQNVAPPRRRPIMLPRPWMDDDPSDDFINEQEQRQHEEAEQAFWEER